MSQQTELENTLSGFQKNAPEAAKTPINAARATIMENFDYSKTIHQGDVLPEFTLQNALGKPVSSKDLLDKGPILITFYRGSWCPFCNIALHHLQQHVADFEAKGVTLVAISPELPDTSLSESEKRGLTFPALSDVKNAFARKLGIVWKQPEDMRPVFGMFGHDLEGRNGDDSLEVPVPASLLVDQKGVVRNTYIEANYTKRLDPKVALEWVNQLQ